MLIDRKSYRTIWHDKVLEKVQIIDQTKLPFSLEIISLECLDDVLEAINSMQVRGAPLIGATAAFGIYLAYRELKDKTKIAEAAAKIKNTRPTAVNLFWAVDKMMGKINHSIDKNIMQKTLLEEAEKICESDVDACKKIGINGFELIKKIHDNKKNTVNILTHCNAGWLATIDWGTATAPIYLAKKNNIDIHVWVDETRPRNQGASLTSYELNHEQVDNTIITDNSAGLLMQRNQIDLCIVGADRVTYTGHVANKIGTFLKAVIAKEFRIPFYVAIPISTIDWNTRNYNDIAIEERSDNELRKITGLDNENRIKTLDIYPKNSKVYNPAFDITPKEFVQSLITNKGIIKPNEDDIAKLKDD
ncbi:MAG: Methylthioribose-1-phosphate isomerase [Alphaproteobacteria bacterium MarineAlpha9_Bin4]|nr:S-methyl-5-thioribose-1-phosphate isomerase [Pelagibacterales bacterium]PPR26230.1 MAG: Methylthioribose-1-phosphate isomerase [Alphaproteobacteria bacterium MarineAlpha9_Bin4]|tara:strand:+ start:4801 stop:5883 length:1083 start_codon:yes stop_codon:yes gene_type:complete